MIGQAHHFVDGMADIDNGQVDTVAHQFDVIENFRLAMTIERSERLIHQKQTRIGQQGPPDRHTLLLATGQRCRSSVHQMLKAEQGGDRSRFGQTRTHIGFTIPIEQVLPDRKVRK